MSAPTLTKLEFVNTERVLAGVEYGHQTTTAFKVTGTKLSTENLPIESFTLTGTGATITNIVVAADSLTATGNISVPATATEKEFSVKVAANLTGVNNIGATQELFFNYKTLTGTPATPAITATLEVNGESTDLTAIERVGKITVSLSEAVQGTVPFATTLRTASSGIVSGKLSAWTPLSDGTG